MEFTPFKSRIAEISGRRRITSLVTVMVVSGIVPFSDGSRTALAQIIPDSTLPTNSMVIENGTVSTVLGGTTSGNYLFHSFETFSILDGLTASFDHATTVDSIVTRVTGNSESMINGGIETQGSADFFLLNPNGVVFGPNAQLNVGGSFIGSSAESILFEDGGVFSAVNPQAPPLLTVNTSLGLQYGGESADLTVQGNGHNLLLDDETSDVVLTNRPNGLEVLTGQTLGLIGGDVLLEGGNITTVSGRAIVGGVRDGTVMLTDVGNGWTADYSNVDTFGDVHLSNAASVLTSGNGGGAIHLHGDTVRIRGGSALLANTLGDSPSQGVTIDASDVVRVVGAILDDEGEASFSTSVFSEVTPGASGTGGDILITSPRLRIARGAQISASTLGPGDAGDMTVVADRINIDGGAGFLTPSGLFVNVLNTDATGRGGDLSILAQRLNITGGAEIAANTFGIGDAGGITLEVDEVSVVAGAPGLGSSGIFAQSEVEATGSGGTIAIAGDRLQIIGGASIDVTTFFSGAGGRLQILVDSLLLDGQSPNGTPASIAAVADENASGQGGTIAIETQTLELRNGAQLITSTFGAGDVGTLLIDAEHISLAGGDDLETVISSAVEENATGQGGLLSVTTDTLSIVDGAQMSTGTTGNGPGGDLRIQAQSIDIQGRNNLARSGIVASALEGEGAGGDVTIDADLVSISDGGIITASNFSTANDQRAPGRGPAGNVLIRSERINLADGEITASTAVGDQGDITIEGSLLLLSDRSAITTNAAGADGGNIDIASDYVVAFDNSDITANASQGMGGQVTITASGIFGSQFSEVLTPQSDITATSNLGPQFNGVVQLNTPDVDPLQGTVELPSGLLDPSTQIIAACEQFRGNELVITGRGGLPHAPTQLRSAVDIWPDLRLETAGQERAQSNREEWLSEPQPISNNVLEAQFWHVNADGDVDLMAVNESSVFSIAQDTVSCD